MVDAIWSDLGLRYPPCVEPLPRHATTTLARANRLAVFLPARIPSWCLLHELAHAMTTTDDGRCRNRGRFGRGADFHGHVAVNRRGYDGPTVVSLPAVGPRCPVQP